MGKNDESSLSFQMNLLPYTKALMPPRSLAIHKVSKHLKVSILQHYRYNLLDSLQKERDLSEKKKKSSDSLKKLCESNPVLISFKVTERNIVLLSGFMFSSRFVLDYKG
ncbi:LOW QUALITY PROTEIN: uncharacterized protein LOC110224221 [Arabidopsis lyrata subsp. lyrata]|uniref:LOW QUALITY PROTEIN: uncharacterized protein LOC110224221 n=1 Tax=Arabidopsis lyrata subsp. lyrata TaxID=81972 RepID=UPI000A29B9DE|nr:LOW QUALITY PROTEIN: uncharacterized protein LOC110224221 [Arabidopsis lyrata subsp. lyrata]|eukprot:XP_020865751.1 LOW QUALITY PROTEIN: uncharacterized protein LOC110224221 [Arabidopsis lyrata subsp. lyrata]